MRGMYFCVSVSVFILTGVALSFCIGLCVVYIVGCAARKFPNVVAVNESLFL